MHVKEFKIDRSKDPEGPVHIRELIMAWFDEYAPKYTIYENGCCIICRDCFASGYNSPLHITNNGDIVNRASDGNEWSDDELMNLADPKLFKKIVKIMQRQCLCASQAS